MAKAKGKHGGPRSPKGGRPKGSKGKATIEREINAAQAIDRARREGRDLAVTVLEQLMVIAGETMVRNRPTSRAKGAKKNPEGDWDRFGSWFDRTSYCATQLAKYQSPQIKAVDIPTAAPEINQRGDDDFTINVFDSGIKVLEFKPRRDDAA
jgi:hypothetical protein